MTNAALLPLPDPARSRHVPPFTDHHRQRVHIVQSDDNRGARCFAYAGAAVQVGRL
jgi:hypothetical protein